MCQFLRSLTHFFVITLCTVSLTILTAPRLTIIFVADQCAHTYFQRLNPYLKGGLRTLLDYGVVYDNAYYPHAMPATGTGHAALNTGCFAKNHGIISNKWFDAQGKLIRCDGDTAQAAAVFDKDGKSLTYGKSAKNLIVPGICTQCVLQDRPNGTNNVLSISYKSRAAILTAGPLGKAFWFDCESGNFTTSKAYFSSMPSWLTQFNKNQKLGMPHTITWELRFAKKSAAYKCKYANDYTFCRYKKSLINTPIKLPSKTYKKEPYELFAMLPHSTKTLLDLALTCIDHNLSSNKNDKLILWICISAPDKLGHIYGPNSLELIDMIYHLDSQLKTFMRKVESRIKKSDILYAFTADHGVAPIPELVNHEGIKSAIRIDENALVQRLNQAIEKKFSVKNVVQHYRTPQFYFDTVKLNALEPPLKQEVMTYAQHYLLTEPGIKNAWTTQKLLATTFDMGSIESFYKNQIYPGRSGQLAIQVLPFCQTTKYPSGTAHITPYEDNTHVPLILYQKGVTNQKHITQRISMLQFANSIAQLVDIPKAPASTFDILPELFAGG